MPKRNVRKISKQDLPPTGHIILILKQPADFANREAEGILLVPHAGETLYRPKPGVV